MSIATSSVVTAKFVRRTPKIRQTVARDSFSYRGERLPGGPETAFVAGTSGVGSLVLPTPRGQVECNVQIFLR